MSASPYPYWRLSSFYLFYYACLGAWIPYWPLYVQYIGHSALVIGITSAVFHSTRIIAPNLWGYLSDRTGQRLRVIRYGCFFAFGAILGLLWGRDVWLLTTVLFIFSFFWSAVLPQFEVLTLNYLGDKKAHDYGRVRLWGSVGFIAAVLAAGWVFDILPMSAFPWVICAVLMSLWVSSLVVPAENNPRIDEADKGSSGESFLKIISKHHVWAYLLSVILMQISFGPYYNFFSILLRDSGYPVSAVSLFWFVAIAAEILVFIYIRHFYSWFGVKNLLILSIALSVLRWVITAAFADNVLVMAFAQLLHAFSFATFHACMIEQVRRLFPASEHGKGQALFNSIGYGLGAVLGAAGGGLLWDQLGNQLFYVAAAMSGLSLLIAYFVLKHDDFSGTDSTVSVSENSETKGKLNEA